MKGTIKFSGMLGILYVSTFFPIFTYFFSLLFGLSLPYLGDIFLFSSLLCLVIFNFKVFRFKLIDLIFLAYVLLVLYFIFKNFNYFNLFFGISEIRYIIFIPFFYFLFRSITVYKLDSFNIYSFLFTILKVNLIICLMEFCLINFSPISDLIISRASSIYLNKDRIYDSIFGNLFKPVGLFPGSGNTSIAVSLLFLMFLHNRNRSLVFFIANLFGLIITFTFTSLIVLISGFTFLFVKKFKVWHFILFVITLTCFLFLSPQITNFRSTGVSEIDFDFDFDSFYLAMDVYLLSYDKYIEEFRLFAHTFSQSDLLNISNLIGPTGEIYLLRVGIYFGTLLLLLFLVLAIYFLQLILITDNVQLRFLNFIPFVLIITSLHYPSINGIGLYILLPLCSSICSKTRGNSFF